MGVTVRSTNNIPRMKGIMAKLGKQAIKVGVFGDTDATMVKIARAHEFGVTIKPKHRKFLALPLPAAGKKRPKDFDDLVFVKSDDDNRAYLMRPTGKRGKMKPYFILLKRVVIPERSFLRTGFDKNVNPVMDTAEKWLGKVIDNGLNPATFAEMLGLEFAGKVQEHLRAIQSPPNAKLTVANKKSDNPLIDEGHLVQAIRHKIE
jgi:hypothetical protein